MASPSSSPSSSHLPQGDCRYILLLPGVQGQRCACVGFALNRGIPGSTCDCGHQACYHAADKEFGSIERQELHSLQEKIALLESKLDERHVGRPEFVERLGRLEECVDKSTTDNEEGFKDVYRGMRGLWHNISLLQKRTPHYDDRIERLMDDVQGIRNRLIEVDDASMRLEDRVEALERSTTTVPSVRSGRRKASTPPSVAPENYQDSPVKSEDAAPAVDSISRLPLHIVTSEEPADIQSFRERVASVGSGSEAWTVHISLLPTSSQPFPFEKDTAAYKRCLSRGLHRVVAIPDSDDQSFRSAVSEAFSEILRGRPWVPLVARICDAKNLRGLPMLRQLPEWLVGSEYNAEFLKSHCAVTDEIGTIIDLYIAMSDDTISWAELKELTPYLDGLEASWTYDPYLDGPCLDDGSDSPSLSAGCSEKRPAAGDILWSPSLKRKESEITRTPSFGSSTDGEGSRVKLRRQCTATSVEFVGWRAEAV